MLFRSPGCLGLFVLQGLFESTQFAFGELEGLGFVAEHAFSGFFDALLEIVQFALGTIAECLACLAEITLAELIDHFLSGKVDKVLLVYSEFQSVARQVPVVKQLLPVVAEEEDSTAAGEEYIFEPSPAQLLDALVPRHVNFQIWRALLESNAGEQAARMQAMDNATKNAGDLIEELTREMNKVRQTSITLELMDIVGGAEAVS